METIFRVQDKNGRGPWKPGFSHKWVEDRDDHDNLLPWYIEFGRVDQELLIGESSGSGCRTVDQLKRWFTESEYRKLKKLGYRAVKMSVNRVIAESDIQLFFGRAKALKKDVQTVCLYKKNTEASARK